MRNELQPHTSFEYFVGACIGPTELVSILELAVLAVLYGGRPLSVVPPRPYINLSQRFGAVGVRPGGLFTLALVMSHFLIFSLYYRTALSFCYSFHSTYLWCVLYSELVKPLIW